jgi:hypothetical protein
MNQPIPQVAEIKRVDLGVLTRAPKKKGNKNQG